MCGIAGFSGGFSKSLLGDMGSSIAHRGTDGNGEYFDTRTRIGLVHRRLSIIDLSDAGAQPICNEDSSIWITFNGEIYNYQALRSELIAQGHKFKSNSDTEVLVHGYEEWGIDALLEKLNGIFAFAIYDSASSLSALSSQLLAAPRLIIARDGVGVKPLYYAETPKGFLFASEMKAILQEPSIDRSINLLAVQNYLTFLWSPAPDTMLKSVKKLEPGHAMIVQDGTVEKKWQFYDLPYNQPIKTMSEQQTVDVLQRHVGQAVERQMVADVPVGAFLSGGLDSSSVVHYARQYAGKDRLQCFTIGFNDDLFAREGMADDLPYAQKVAKHLDVDLQTIYVSSSDMAAQLSEMIYHLDEPQADPAPINASFICKLAKEQGIKVLLSGAGGDDIFTGYRRHYAQTLESWWAWLPKSVRSMMKTGTSTIAQGSSVGRRLAKAFAYADRDGDERIASYFAWTNSRQLRSLYRKDSSSSIDADRSLDPLISALSRLPKEVLDLNRMLFLDGKFFLADHNLNYTDKMGMAHGVEVRVPLLDPDLVSFAYSLPLNFKQHGRTGKWIFKKAMEPYLPLDVIYRPKTGFGAPLRHWLRYELRNLVEDLLSPVSLNRRGIFDPTGVSRLIEMDRKGQVDAAYTIFSLICIELWFRIFLDNNAQKP